MCCLQRHLHMFCIPSAAETTLPCCAPLSLWHFPPCQFGSTHLSYHMHVPQLTWCLQGQAGMQQSSPKAKLSAGLNSSSPAASPLASLVASHPHPHAHGILVQSGAPSMVPPSHPKPIQTGPSGDSFPANRAAELARQTSKQVC